MTFKINISHKGKTHKVETENEVLVGKKIGETISGSELDENLAGYDLEITGTSDLSGIPGFKDLEGPGYHRILRTRGKGMRDTRNGVRLRKTNRGEEISGKTHQINTKVLKEGSKKFDQLTAKEEPAEEAPATEPAKEEEKKEE
tara:strand:+ start:32 stop:463 length:432 start_codon:yes stop_codon:yes gene_type:complete